jgi:hypothetical protein
LEHQQNIVSGIQIEKVFLMIKLKGLLSEAKNDLIANRVWDYIISNEVWITEESLKEISDKVASVSKKNKKGVFDAVLRIGKEKNWFTEYVTDKVFGD